MTTFGYGALLLLGVVLLVVTAVRVLVGGVDTGQRGPAQGQDSARRILDRRYAAGELSTEEYRHRLEVLGRGES